MKCMSCDTEINPKWKHAIDSNVCPFCGNVIMDINLRNLLHSLRESLEAFPKEFSPHLDDWLFSNYNYIKADSEKLVKNQPEKQKPENKKFMVKVETENGPQEVVAEKIQSEEKTNGFFNRAEAVRPNIDGFKSTSEKTEYLRKVVQKIKKSGSTNADESADAELMAQMAEDLENSESAAIQSSLATNNDDDDIPSVVLNMASQQSKGSSTSNMKDLMDLQRLQDRVNNSRKNFESGENRGKGGFSRV